MPAYYGDDDTRPRATAALSPDYYYSGGAPGPYATGAIPVPSNARLQYQPQSPFYTHPAPNASVPSLHRDASPYRRRPRSLPPPVRPKSRRGDRDLSPPGADKGPRGPVQEARHLINHTFSNSNSGLGMGVLGALAGGLIAHEATGAKPTSRSHGRRRTDHKSPLLPTIVGAAVAGLAANAFEKKMEVAKVRNAEKEAAWERKWGRRSGADARDDLEEDRGRRRSRRRSSGIYYDDHALDGDFYRRPAR
ncbi:hypothetical protein J7T55_006871 [Diaporthe amygdali]|uniref:uncharacterized protein n=1 Tax=Phomopsis amygdali TaxID=1214568 RepID=UPI0022FF0691|nr:uncharacterized protein J7T55_006871 [Diaporthe amygdali]KAJ0125522.1 hypothetical protein J7T55_006871 [Diaporthe amygdali]